MKKGVAKLGNNYVNYFGYKKKYIIRDIETKETYVNGIGKEFSSGSIDVIKMLFRGLGFLCEYYEIYSNSEEKVVIFKAIK